jgi:Tol biopolymer transport system component
MYLANGSLVQELVPVLISGLWGLFLILVSAVVLAVAIACLTSVLGMWLRPRDELGLRRAVWLFALAVPMLAGPALAAQAVSAQKVPIVEPSFTRIFGTDSIEISANASNIMDDRSVAVSPDGHWIAWEGVREGVSEIWVVSMTGKGPVQVSGSAHDFNANPVWFPDSRRLAFRSGSAAFGPFIHSVELDPDTGHPVGPPRQVSIEPIQQRGFGVSPDGSRIAYGTPLDDGRQALRVVPANGGTARTLWETEAPIWWPVWSPNGESVYVMTGVRRMMRVVRSLPVEGGAAKVAAEWEDGLLAALSPDGRYVTRGVTTSSGEELWELATIDGRGVARFKLPENMGPVGFWPGEPAILAAAKDVAAPLQVLPVNGGPARQLTETRAMDSPLRWMPNGRELFMETQLDGETVFMLMAVEAGGTRQVRLPEPRWRGTSPTISDEGRYVGFVTGRYDEEPTVKTFDLQDGSVQLVTDSPCGRNRYQLWPTWDGDRFLYCESAGDRHEYRAVSPGGLPELLMSYSGDVRSLPSVGVRGNRVAFTKNEGENGSLLVATAGREDARSLVTLPGRIGALGMQGPVWSPDGRTIVVGYARPGGEDVEALLVRLTADGQLDGEPTILELEGGPLWWWDPQWLPDGGGLVIGGMGSATVLDLGVWMVSLDPEVNPVELTADDPNPIGGFVLSPDGRQIVYSSERPSGSSFWKVELGDIEGGRR